MRNGSQVSTNSNCVRLGRGAVRLLSLVATLTLVACGGGDDDRKPDTGYGLGQVVPAPQSCSALCARLGDCVIHLCSEDSGSSSYQGLGDLVIDSCMSGCSDSSIESAIKPSQWQCLFQDSCRQVFDYDACKVQASYYCK